MRNLFKFDFDKNIDDTVNLKSGCVRVKFTSDDSKLVVVQYRKSSGEVGFVLSPSAIKTLDCLS
ncbi:MAG: hypothetical protein LBN01_00500 [Endomicrobium sp.]|nr:hypothetical protein [Endomicrobium sp.]